MSTVATLGGWVAAGIVASMLVVSRRILGERRAAVARACHELRGPLTAVRLGLARGGIDAELPPGRLRAIDAELGRAALALDDLAQLRGGRPRLGPLDRVDLAAVVADSVEAWRALAEATGVRVDHCTTGMSSGGGAVWGDRGRLAQAVGNLVANAIEHGGGDVVVRVLAGAGVVRAEVDDDGAGLPAPVAELVRRGRRTRGARGHGLAIAAAVATAHGGRLATAPTASGARLVLELPAAR